MRTANALVKSATSSAPIPAAPGAVAGSTACWCQSIALSGIDGIALTKLDVLDGFDQIKICTGYKLGDKTYDYLPASLKDQEAVTPVYETLEGWKATTRGVRSSKDLPANAIKYI